MNDESIIVPEEFVDITFPPLYPRGWKALQLSCQQWPEGIRQWTTFLWGWDIFYGKFPLIKSLLVVNTLIWIILILLWR